MKYLDVPIRIRYGETDKMGVSYYANYLVWFEASRSELFRELGVAYTTIEQDGLLLPVAEAHCKYYQSTGYDDLIYIRVSVSQLKMSTMRFTYQVLNEAKDTLIAWGYTTHLFVDMNKKAAKIPAVVRDVVTVHALPEKGLVHE